MGLFDWFRGSKSHVQVDERIWLTKQAKYAGIERDITEALTRPDGPDAVFVVAHFEDCLEDLQALVSDSEYDEQRVRVTWSQVLVGRTATAVSDPSYSMLILMGERHPLLSRDREFQKYVRSMACHCHFVQHVSLEDALLKEFAGEWVEKTLRQLGMSDSDAIESQMVARRIQAAQQKIENKALGDGPARSAAKWLEKYCPNR